MSSGVVGRVIHMDRLTRRLIKGMLEWKLVGTWYTIAGRLKIVRRWLGRKIVERRLNQRLVRGLAPKWAGRVIGRLCRGVIKSLEARLLEIVFMSLMLTVVAKLCSQLTIY